MKSAISRMEKAIIENAFHDYNNIRSHSTLNYYSSVQFLDKWNNDESFREIL
ncbi:hypothetical protein [Picrophilus oshimae]|uniref:hypothetical protein n=1 Tax=Picrophilus oshimae TaxID=46632 RepID=UPI001293DEBF|nr:hypothetical protein [Picrophilus oshimae]